MKILEDLWAGQLCPSAKNDYRNDELCDLLRLYERNEEKLLETFSEAQKGIWEKMQNIDGEIKNIQECNAFIDGFQLAVQLMTAAFQK